MELRHFLAVAEELHFARAADRLGAVPCLYAAGHRAIHVCWRSAVSQWRQANYGKPAPWLTGLLTVGGSTSMLIGYARVSIEDQHLGLQRDALARAGCERTFEDQRSGAKVDRPGLLAALDYVRWGDSGVV